MNILLQQKLIELQNAADYECWYLVKQPTDFDNLCYLVSFLESYQRVGNPGTIKDYVVGKAAELNLRKPGYSVGDNYRALRVAAFFGLITFTSANYADCIITPTFYEVKDRCNGDFENINSYMDIIQRQIEKIYISSQIDEEYERVRREYRLYPVLFLYKILLELGKATGNYSISMTEYRYLVATTKTYDKFLETLLLINLLRQDNVAIPVFEKLRQKFDNRFNKALQQLPTLVFEDNRIKLATSKIKEVAEKVFFFENNKDAFMRPDYQRFLGSTESLFDELSDKGKETEEENLKKLEEVKGAKNIIYYGVPGSGKSYKVNEDFPEGTYDRKRVVFHPDYTNADFVGQILPCLNASNQLEYKFNPGPFTKILSDSIKNTKTKYCLIIEEINRGNAPAIFGEIFQLLDRDEHGESRYGITNSDIAKEVYGNENAEIRIPNNLTIIATMNTSDQNVFTLDTAFQRRWDMKHISNDFAKNKYAGNEIPGSKITWEIFAETVNEKLSELNVGFGSTEDKGLGAFFVSESELQDKDKFAGKVLKYLWDDAFKMDRKNIFLKDLKQLHHVLEKFEKPPQEDGADIDPLKAILKEEVYKEMLDKVALKKDSGNKQESNNTSSEAADDAGEQ